jgi:hypothetical protein
LPQGYDAGREKSNARTALGLLPSNTAGDELVEQLAASTISNTQLESGCR